MKVLADGTLLLLPRVAASNALDGPLLEEQESANGIEETKTRNEELNLTTHIWMEKVSEANLQGNPPVEAIRDEVLTWHRRG